MAAITKEERAALNALALRGMHGAALCVERLIMHGETIHTVTITGPGVHIDILPPDRHSKLWADAATWRTTAAEVNYFTVRYNCEIRWTLTSAEDELHRIAEASRRVH